MMNRASREEKSTSKNSSTFQQSTPPLVFMPTLTCASRPREALSDVQPIQVPSCDVSERKNACDGGMFQPRPEDSPIKVTFRTRDGTRSPYLTPIQTNNQVELEFGSGIPYAHSCSGRSSPVYAITPSQFTPRFPTFSPLVEKQDTPSIQPTAQAEAKPSDPLGKAENLEDKSSATPAAMAELPSDVVHRALQGRCRFIAFPSPLPSESVDNKLAGCNSKGAYTSYPGEANNLYEGALFIGQVRFETTPAELLWLIHRVSGACVSRLESRGAGCYIVYCRSSSDLQLVRSIHKRVLFDIRGVWFARTAEEIDALCEYVALEAPFLSRKAHLPHDSMVVEEHKADAYSLGGLRHPMMQGDRHAPIYLPYSTAFMPPGQSISQMYAPCVQYPPANPYVAAGYHPIFPQLPVANPSAPAPPPPYNS